jgi:putative PIN family toxin of toxin-antitoxin system
VIRAVVDANVLISSVISHLGASRRVFNAWIGGSFDLITSPGILEEVSRRLAHPRIAVRYSITDEDRVAIIRLLMSRGMMTPGVLKVSITRDPTDDKIIAAAIEAGAAYIVTGDKDLLDLREHEGIAIVTPAQFVEALAAAT